MAALRLKRPPFSGPQVRKLQQRLKALGYDIGSVDGVFGPSTDRCVKAFQGAHGLAADGVVGLLICSASTEEDALAELADVIVDGPTGLATWLNELAGRLNG